MQDRRHQERVITFVLAGGEGKRMMPLTAGRCKPAVPFGARYRIVDFVLSNLINSGIRSIYLLVQYKPQALIEHIRKAWVISPLLPDLFVTVVPPEMHEGHWSFKGTADAVYQSLRLIQLHRPDIVAVFGADHVYRMDVRQMMVYHHECNADVTVVARPVPIDEAPAFGVIEVERDGRICDFQEKPVRPRSIPGDPGHALVSMGNYLFRTDVLVKALEEANARGDTDFGQHVLPQLLSTHRLYAYDFSTNEVPGIKAYEEVGYWRDLGNVDAFYRAHADVLGEQPRFDVFNPQWPVFSSNYQGPVARILGGDIENSLLGAATLVYKGVRVRNSIVRREAVLEPDVELEDCIIMDYARIGRGSRLRGVIVDRHNAIPPGSHIGFDGREDARRYYVSPGGVVVVPRGESIYYARDSRGSGFGYAE
jgi:glucose-1-phosphate adenylyltransferase